MDTANSSSSDCIIIHTGQAVINQLTNLAREVKQYVNSITTQVSKNKPTQNGTGAGRGFV